jgi:predicted Rossmann-fold nucleotide-binding protein
MIKAEKKNAGNGLSTIIAGGRDYRLTEADLARLDDLPIREVVSGGSTGVDSAGEEWARSRGIPVKRFPADWKRHGYGAGPRRNREMAEYAEAVVLFPGGRGTASMRREAEKAGIQIYDFST